LIDESEEHWVFLLVATGQPTKGIIMFKITALTGALIIGMASASFAQTPSPAGQGSAEQSNSSTGANSGSGSSTRPTGTTGMSKTEMNPKGDANSSSPSQAPITGQPVGKDSQSETPKRQ
jgi:hypothetical protein